MRRAFLRYTPASLSACVLVLACSSDPPADDTPPAAGKAGTGTSGRAAGGSGATGGSVAGGGAGGTAAGKGGTGSGGVGGSAGTGSAMGGTSGTGTGGVSGGAGMLPMAGQGGLAGNAGSGATAGSGQAGTAMGGAAGDTTAMGGMAGNAGTSAAWPACSPDALFCSGFEDAALPTGATYLSSNDNNDATKGLVFDKTVFHGGAQAVEVLKDSSYAQREIVVAAAQTFWFRAYLRTDVAIGGPMGNNHNLFFEAAWQGGDKGIEIVEEDCMLGLNIMDSRYGSNGTTNQPGCPTSGNMGTQVTADEWHCFEGYFDGSKGDVRVFVDNTEVLTQAGLSGVKQNFTTLRFGYRHYHERQRLVWYDDVVTGPTRIGCN